MKTALIPVTLVTGFLGSGKTTFLLKLAEHHPHEKIIFLVNEFARENVDGPALMTTGRPTHSVVGGSLFCECKAGDFVRLMRDDIASMPVSHVVIETSGIADPSAIGRLMHDHQLDQAFEIRRIVNIVAPKRFPQLHANLASVRAQVQACDTIIFNQTDLASPGQIERSHRLVAAANPNARLISGHHCEVEFDLNEVATAPALPAEPLAKCDSNPFTSATVQFDRAVSLTRLRAAIANLPTAILRLKGRVRTSAGWREVQCTVNTTTIVPCDRGEHSQLVVIAHDRNEPTLNRIVRQLSTLQR